MTDKKDCAVEDCTKDYYAKGFCRNHYANYNRCGNPLGRRSEPKPPCDCGKESKIRGMCKACYMRWYLDNTPGAREKQNAASRAYVRPEGLAFEPLKEVVGYFQMHKRLKYIKGRPSNFTCANGCGRAGQEWALIHGRDFITETRKDGAVLKYSLNTDDYRPLCKLCHRREDGCFGRTYAA